MHLESNTGFIIRINLPGHALNPELIHQCQPWSFLTSTNKANAGKWGILSTSKHSHSVCISCFMVEPSCQKVLWDMMMKKAREKEREKYEVSITPSVMGRLCVAADLHPFPWRNTLSDHLVVSFTLTTYHFWHSEVGSCSLSLMQCGLRSSVLSHSQLYGVLALIHLVIVSVLELYAFGKQLQLTGISHGETVSESLHDILKWFQMYMKRDQSNRASASGSSTNIMHRRSVAATRTKSVPVIRQGETHPLVYTQLPSVTITEDPSEASLCMRCLPLAAASAPAWEPPLSSHGCFPYMRDPSYFGEFLYCGKISLMDMFAC